MGRDLALEAMTALPGIMVGHLWCVHPNHPDYLIGDHGVVVSMVKAPRVLSPTKRGQGGYKGFALKDAGGDIRPVYQHRLVAEAFFGPPPEGDTHCRHLDGNCANNDVTNLS